MLFKSLSKQSTKESVANALSVDGKLKFVRFPFSKNTQKNLGYGYFIYENITIGFFVLNSVKEVKIDEKKIQLQPFTEDYQLIAHK